MPLIVERRHPAHREGVGKKIKASKMSFFLNSIGWPRVSSSSGVCTGSIGDVHSMHEEEIKLGG